MGLSSVSPRISREEFDDFKRLVKDDPEFPADHARWVKLIEQSDAERRARGLLIQELEIHPQEFANWCAATALDPNFYTLMAFAVAKAKGHGKTHR